MIVNPGDSGTFEAFFKVSGVGTNPNPLPTVDIYNPDGTKVVSDGEVVMLGTTGWATYNYDNLVQVNSKRAWRAIFKTTDATVDEKQIPSLIWVGTGWTTNIDSRATQTSLDAMRVVVDASKTVVDGLHTLVDVTLSTRASAVELSAGIASIISAISGLPDEIYTDDILAIQAQLVSIFNVASANETGADAAARFAEIIANFGIVLAAMPPAPDNTKIAEINTTVGIIENKIDNLEVEVTLPDNIATTEDLSVIAGKVDTVITKVNALQGDTITTSLSSPLQRNYRVPENEICTITYSVDPVPTDEVVFTLKRAIMNAVGESTPVGDIVISQVLSFVDGMATIAFVAPDFGYYKYEISINNEGAFVTYVEGKFSTYRRVAE